MLSITTDQVQGLETRALAAFLDEMEAWAAETYPERRAQLPPDMLRDEVLRARKLGFVLRGHVRRWIAMGMELGMPFAAAGWAGSVAGDVEMSPAVRLDILEREATLVLLQREEEAEQGGCGGV